MRTSTFIFGMSMIACYANWFMDTLIYAVPWLLLGTYALGYGHAEDRFFRRMRWMCSFIWSKL